MSPDAPHPTRCPNCNHPVSLPDDLYCRHCGQESLLELPTVLGFVREFTGQYLSTHGAMARSLMALLVPGRLTEEYLRGRRRHYVLPLRLLLTLAFSLVVVTWLLRTLLPLPPEHRMSQILDPRHAHEAALDRPSAFFHAGGILTHIGQRDGSFYCRGLNESSCDNLKSQWQQSPQQLAKIQAQGMNRITQAAHWLALLLVPWMALMTRRLYARRQLRYAVHMVLALHLGAGMAVIGMASTLFSQLTPSLGMSSILPGLALSFIYMAVGWQRILGGRWWLSIIRFALLGLGWLLGQAFLTLLLLDLHWLTL